MTIQHIAILIICAVVFTSGYETTYSDTTSNAANYNNTTNNATNITGKYESSAGVQVVNNNNNVVCFSGDSQVQLFNGTWKIIGELQPGDHVHAYNGSKLVSAELIMMLDRHSFKNAIFHTFKTASGHEISLTGLHLIGVVSFNGVLIYKPAKDVQIGDQLFVLSNQDLVPSSIVEMTINVKQGYYAPLTTEGVLFVNGILSSCFSNVKSHDAAQFYMSPLRWYYHTARFLSINDPFGTCSTDGIHWIPKLMFTFGQQFRPSTLLV